MNAAKVIDFPLNSAKNDDRATEIANGVIKDYERMSGNRGTFDQTCQEIAMRILPSHSRTFISRGQNQGRDGEKRNEEVYDSTGAVALGRFASVLESYLTPSNQTWQRLKPSNPYLLKDRPTKLWFEQSNDILFKYRYAPRANFSSNNQEIYQGLGAFGNAVMFIDKLDGEKGLRYKACNLAGTYFDQNHQGLVDKVVRYFPLTARQALQKFGKDILPESIYTAYLNNPEQEFYFIHKVCPREDWDPARWDYKGKKFASYYVSMEGRKLVDEGGFNSFPYSASRYKQAPGDVYGTGPSWDVLPSIKTLNEMKKVLLTQGHKAVDPVLLAYDDGVIDGANLAPGAFNIGGVSSDGRPLIHALPTGNHAIGKELMDDERNDVKDAFLITLFQILVENPQQTATEVVERAKEKGILIAPTMGRIQAEYLGPSTEREMDLLSMQGLLPPMPPALLEAKGEYEIEYDSPLTQARRAGEVSAVMRAVESTLNIVNVTQDPSLLFHYKWEEIIPDSAEAQGVPTRWIRSPDEVAQMKQAHQQANNTQTQIQAAPAAAALIKADAATKGTGK